MSRRAGGPPSSLAVPVSAATAASLAQDAALRHMAHSRAANGGSGSNTEMRALLRKERELEKARASSGSNRENEALPKRAFSTTSSGMTASLSDRKLTQNSSNSSLGAASNQDTDDGHDPTIPRRTVSIGRPPPQGSQAPFALTSSNAIPSGGAAGPKRQLPAAADREEGIPGASSRLPAPPDSFDHSFGVDALQAAFSAKYYELANKCKNWERYAAKLRAQSEVLEVENRVLREQNAQLEVENAALKHEQQQRDQDRYRRDVETRLSSLEDHFSSRKASMDDLDDRFPSGETLVELDQVSAPSAPSSASKSSVGRNNGQITYCSSNLQVEDRPELRPPTPVSALSLPAALPMVPPMESIHQLVAPGRRSLNQSREGMQDWPVYNKRDSASLAEIINQDAAHREAGALYGEGRSSRLSSRRIDADICSNAPRLASLSTSATFPPGPNSSSNDPGALTSQALAAMNRHHAALLGSQDGVRAESKTRPLQAPPHPTQGKRRSTISVDRTLEFDLEQSASAGMQASVNALLAPSGSDARSRGPSSLSDAATVTGDYLQEYVEQRRQQRRTSFTAQQQFHQQQLMGFGSISSQPSSRPASRMSNHSAGGDRTRRARSRAGSVHDAIPVLKDDVFTDGKGSLQPRPSGASPLMDNINVLNGASVMPINPNSPSPQAKERSALMELRCAQPMNKSETSQSSHSLYSGIADYSGSSTELTDESEDQRRAHRKLYASLRTELDPEDLVKFEKYVHRYDALEIGLEGPRGLINRVKKLLLLTDPALKSKPEKLRVRKELAREFEKVVKNTT